MKDACQVAALVQARLGSTRLPLKSLLCLDGLPIIDWVTKRLGMSSMISEIIVAIPDTPVDTVLEDHLRKRGVKVVKGPENDVLGRMNMALSATEAKHVVRICADNPLIWWEAVDRLAGFYLSGDYDYAYNHIPRNNLWPDGLGAEIVSRNLLTKLDGLAENASQREHCLNYIWDNPDKFRIGTFDPEENWLKRPDLKLDVDTPEDFIRLARLKLTPQSGAGEILSRLDGDPAASCIRKADGSCPEQPAGI